MRYPSGRSTGFGILIWGVILLLAGHLIFFLWQANWIIPLGMAAGIAFLLWIWFGTYYEFRERYLLARMGPFFERIPYNKIYSARKFKSMASSMALSSNMIELRHGKSYITGTTYISPLDRDRFLTELKIHSPALNRVSQDDSGISRDGQH